MKTFKENARKATNLLLTVIPQIAAEDWSDTLAELQVSCSVAHHNPRAKDTHCGSHLNVIHITW